MDHHPSGRPAAPPSVATASPPPQLPSPVLAPTATSTTPTLPPSPPQPMPPRPSSPVVVPGHGTPAGVPAQIAPMAGGASMPDAVLGCCACGQSPARHVVFRKNTGLVVSRQYELLEGRLCRTCGTGAFRKYTNHCLLFGWWGFISFFANFHAIAKNLVTRVRLLSLKRPPESVPGAPGRPMYLRLGPYLAAGGLLLVGNVVVEEVTTSAAEKLDGECVRVTGNELVDVSCSSSHTGKVLAVISLEGDELCPMLTDEMFVLDDDQAHGLCIDADQ